MRLSAAFGKWDFYHALFLVVWLVVRPAIESVRCRSDPHRPGLLLFEFPLVLWTACETTDNTSVFTSNKWETSPPETSPLSALVHKDPPKMHHLSSSAVFHRVFAEEREEDQPDARLIPSGGVSPEGTVQHARLPISCIESDSVSHGSPATIQGVSPLLGFVCLRRGRVGFLCLSARHIAQELLFWCKQTVDGVLTPESFADSRFLCVTFLCVRALGESVIMSRGV